MLTAITWHSFWRRLEDGIKQFLSLAKPWRRIARLFLSWTSIQRWTTCEEIRGLPRSGRSSFVRARVVLCSMEKHTRSLDCDGFCTTPSIATLLTEEVCSGGRDLEPETSFPDQQPAMIAR